VILPRSTRRRICRALNMLRNKSVENPWKKYDNIPLQGLSQVFEARPAHPARKVVGAAVAFR